jgi:glycosyltransferase involved in cell wall biosynthesis
VFTLPTLREPFGLAFLDAMACAVPCVGTRTGAIPEVVADGATGLLVPPDDAAALAAAIAALLEDVPRARAMGEAGRARVAAGFRWEHVAAKLERALADASTGRPAEAAA